MHKYGTIEVEFLSSDGDALDRLEIGAPPYDGTVWVKILADTLARPDVTAVRTRLRPTPQSPPRELAIQLLPMTRQREKAAPNVW